jgi:type I restriction enzyme, S subunit
MRSKGWESMTLGDFVTLQRGHDLPESKRRPGNVPVIGSFGITGYHDIAKAKGPGVTIGRSGASFGVVSYSPVNYWPHNAALYVTDFHGNDERFSYYFIKSIDFKNYNSGSAQPSLNRNYIYPIEIKVPPLPIQRKIAAILSTYDRLIENNTRRIKILEEMARSLYREWFVKFRFPGHEQVKMIDSELGLIPEGWEVVTLENILKLTHGYAFKSEQLHKEKTSYVVVRMGNFKETGGLQFEDNIRYIEPGSFKEKYLLKANDLVMVFSDVTRAGGIIGNVGLIPNDNNRYVLNQRVVKVDLVENLKLFFYIYFNSEVFKNHCLSRADSATVLNLKNEHIYQHQVVLPSQETLSYFIENFDPIIRKIQNLDKRNINLRQTRDLLLPKLISGEIDVENLDIKTSQNAA